MIYNEESVDEITDPIGETEPIGVESISNLPSDITNDIEEFIHHIYHYFLRV